MSSPVPQAGVLAHLSTEGLCGQGGRAPRKKGQRRTCLWDHRRWGPGTQHPRILARPVGSQDSAPLAFPGGPQPPLPIRGLPGQNVTMDEGGTPLLPDSLIYQIFLSLGPADVLAAGLVCRRWQAVSRDEFLWREQFYRYYQVARDVPRHPAATSWYEEFRRLYDTVPCVEVQTLKEHTDQVLHLSFSHSGYQFASCSKDCTVKIWSNDLTISLLHSADMRPYNWSYTQFSQFNQDDSLLLASGVFLGPHNSSSGEIAVISLDNFALLSRVRNKPYDVFGCWLTETSLISGNLHRIGDITSCSVLWLNNAFQVRARVPPAAAPSLAWCPPAVSHPQDVESENVNVVKRLFKIQNLNASTIRTVMVADCSRFDSPDLLLDASGPPGRVFDLGSDSEDEAAGLGPGPAPARTKEGLRRFLDGLLDGRAQSQLSEHALETRVAELLAQGRTKPPEHSMADARKLLIFTTGCLTYSPHQIGIKQILPHQMTTAGPVLGEGRGSDAFFDALDHVIDVHGHIIGMGLSPDNSRAWPSGSVVADPMQPPPIAEEIDLLVFDLKTMREVKRALRAHRAYTPNDECFFIFLDVSRDFVASGAEDRHGYIWDRHYNICLAKLRHQDVVNSVVFSPQEQELLLTASDDATIKAWRSPRTVRIHQAPRPRPHPFLSWFASQRR
ncbi:F-box/WD repeat-containing protein 5 isoform X2 [Leptonychotes weddellii]|uniref:F-box/WD repeat-containing protein 5 isoform X2 n=1 Tax=Leptonychotes weddellii TaxID=9713 RepID=A0A7F8R6K0_LEPWE|nr:F-box/WD repeat-containing protein 5 isoform X2 [Leptonychotes weddellii]